MGGGRARWTIFWEVGTLWGEGWGIPSDRGALSAEELGT